MYTKVHLRSPFVRRSIGDIVIYFLLSLKKTHDEYLNMLIKLLGNFFYNNIDGIFKLYKY